MPHKFFKTLIIFCLGILSQHISMAAKPVLTINITSNHNKWDLKAGEMTSFIIAVSDSNQVPVNDVKIEYEIGPEMINPYIKNSANIVRGKFVTGSYTMYNPGLLRCAVTVTFEGATYKKVHTVGYDVDKISPTVSEPSDFDSFWNNSKQELAKVPIDARMTLMPEKSTSTVNVYHVSISNIDHSKVYGILAVPKKAGKYPVVLQVPGAGVRSYYPDLGLAEKGVIVFTIGIHGIPVNLDSAVYDDLRFGALNGYYYYNLQSRDKFYYKRVILGSIRAIDFLVKLDNFDHKNVAVMGSSQGGALSIITSALDTRVTSLVSFHPAFCDLTGYLYNQAGGWPHFFAKDNFISFYSRENVQNLAYYDVVNFAKRVKIPGFYSWGYNDEVCPPTSIYAAYNSIAASKKLSLYYETGHWVSPAQRNESIQWLLSYFK